MFFTGKVELSYLAAYLYAYESQLEEMKGTRGEPARDLRQNVEASKATSIDRSEQAMKNFHARAEAVVGLISAYVSGGVAGQLKTFLAELVNCYEHTSIKVGEQVARYEALESRLFSLRTEVLAEIDNSITAS